MTNPSPHDAIIWTGVEQAAQVEATLQLMGPAVRPVAIGGPRVAEIDRLARAWGCPHEDDFRQLLRDRPAPFALLASMNGVDHEDLVALLSQGATVLSTEPIAADFDHLIEPDPHLNKPSLPLSSGKTADPDGVTTQSATVSAPIKTGGVVWVPAMERSLGWQRAAEATQEVGSIQLLSFSSLGRPGDCSLFARLYDGWRLAVELIGLPEEIDASLTGPLREVPENPRGLTGHVGIHARMGNGRTAVIQVSDRAARLGRELSLIGDRGHLKISDHGYDLFDSTGQRLDGHRPTRQKNSRYAELIALHWKHLIDNPPTPSTAPKPPATPEAHILACCLACLLSARTGDPESPRKLLQLHNR